MPKAEETKSSMEKTKQNQNRRQKAFTPKTKRFNSSRQQRSEIKEEQAMPKHNDPAFYTKYKSLSDSVANIAFNHRNGSDLNLNVNANIKIAHNIDPIAVVDYIPVPGKSENLKSGINVAATAAYKVLNRKYRGSMTSRYESADLGIAQFAIMSFYLTLAQAERAYGLGQVAKVNQRQLPREQLFALGYDADELMLHLADFRASLNYIITRAQSLCLVKGYTLLDHHLFLLSNVFKDKDTLRGQYFCYRSFGYWKWNPTKFATGSALEWKPFNNPAHRLKCAFVTPDKYLPLLTTADILAALDDQLDALLGDSDIDTICADILAYFGNENNSPDLIKLSLLPEEYAVEAIYDKDALLQFHNTVIPCNVTMSKTSATAPFNSALDYIHNPIPETVIPSGDTISSFDGLYIYQKDGVIQSLFEYSFGGSWVKFSGTYHKVMTTKNNYMLVAEAIMDTDENKPTVDQVMEWTRNCVLSKEVSHTNDAQTYYYSYLVASVGTVLPTSITVFDFKVVGNNTRDSGGNLVYAGTDISVGEISNVVSLIHEFEGLTKFDWAPILYNSGYVVADLDNYIALDARILTPIHDVAVLSEFHNPVSDVIIKDA